MYRNGVDVYFVIIKIIIYDQIYLIIFNLQGIFFRSRVNFQKHKTVLIFEIKILIFNSYYVNINDISGPYSGVVFGISNSIAGIPGLICPYLTSAITVHVSYSNY